MTKNAENTTYTYNEVEHEQDSNRMMERINSKSDEQVTVEESRCQRHMEEIEKMRAEAMARYFLKGVATLGVAFAFYKAMNSELIAPVLVIPATYLCATYFGWCACKVAAFAKKVRGIK